MKIKISNKMFNSAYLPSLTDYNKRYEVYYGSAGSGKSKFVAQKLIFKALKSKRKILVMRKVNKTSKNSTYQLLLDTLGEWKLISSCRVNKTDLTITLLNGSVFICMGLDDQEKLKSIAGITDAWIEEATEFIQDDFNQIDLRIRERVANSQLILSFNPISKANWCYKLFFKEDFSDPQELAKISNFRQKVKVLRTTYKDNRWLPQEYIDGLLELAGNNYAFYTIYALGEFGSLDKLVYQNWEKEDFDVKNIKGDLMVGLDFGFVNDPTALIASIFCEKEKTIYIFNEDGGQGLDNQTIANMIKENGFKKSTVIADSADQRTIDEIKKMGVYRIKPSIKGPDSIIAGIQKLQGYKLIVHPSCREVIKELQNYSWTKDKATNEYINKPVDKDNHYLDALRYSLQCVNINPKLRTMKKTDLF